MRFSDLATGARFRFGGPGDTTFYKAGEKEYRRVYGDCPYSGYIGEGEDREVTLLDGEGPDDPVPWP